MVRITWGRRLQLVSNRQSQYEKHRARELFNTHRALYFSCCEVLAALALCGIVDEDSSSENVSLLICKICLAEEIDWIFRALWEESGEETAHKEPKKAFDDEQLLPAAQATHPCHL